MYATDRCQTDVRQKHRLMPPPIKAGHNNRSGCIQNIEIYLSEWLSRVMALNTNCFGDIIFVIAYIAPCWAKLCL